MFRFYLVFRFVDHDKEERNQVDADCYSLNHAKEYACTDGLAAGRSRTRCGDQRSDAEND